MPMVAVPENELNTGVVSSHYPTAQELAAWEAQRLADANMRGLVAFAIFVAVVVFVGWLLWRYRRAIRSAMRMTVVRFAATLLRMWRKIIGGGRALRADIVDRANQGDRP